MASCFYEEKCIFLNNYSQINLKIIKNIQIIKKIRTYYSLLDSGKIKKISKLNSQYCYFLRKSIIFFENTCNRREINRMDIKNLD